MMRLMPSTLDRFVGDLARLLETGRKMRRALAKEMVAAKAGQSSQPLKEADQDVSFDDAYQSWYTEAHEAVRQLIPRRLADFELLYHDTREGKSTTETYGIREWLLGKRAALLPLGDKEKAFKDSGVVFMKLKNQHEILESCKARLESSVFQIRALVQADLFDSELGVAQELLRDGHARTGGAIAGVVLQHHLAEVCVSHDIVVKTAKPTISTFNDALKEAEIIETAQWRFIQHLGDIRDSCHNPKGPEPITGEVTDLIAGTAKIIKTVA
jgi:hypothetical protein